MAAYKYQSLLTHSDSDSNSEEDNNQQYFPLFTNKSNRKKRKYNEISKSPSTVNISTPSTKRAKTTTSTNSNSIPISTNSNSNSKSNRKAPITPFARMKIFNSKSNTKTPITPFARMNLRNANAKSTQKSKQPKPTTKRTKRLVQNAKKKQTSNTNKHIPKVVKKKVIHFMKLLYNKVLSPMKKHKYIDQISDLQTLNIEEPDFKQEEIQQYTMGRRLIQKQSNIVRDLNVVIDMMQLEESQQQHQPLITVEFVKQYCKDKEEDCIEKKDGIYHCTMCVDNFDIYIYNRLKASGDNLAAEGDTKYRAKRFYAHLTGEVHRELKKKRDQGLGKNNIPALFNSNKHHKEEFMLNIVLTVYVSIKRAGSSANFYPCIRLINSMVKHWHTMNRDDYKPFTPNIDDIQYNNPCYFNLVRKKIARSINKKYVTKPIQKSMAMHHLIDGYDDKQERYNNLVSLSMPSGKRNTIWLGLIEATSPGAGGALETVFQSYQRHKIDTDKKRPESIGYDGTALNTGCNEGIGARYIKDCDEKKFVFKPIEIVCAGHHGQNYNKVLYNQNPNVMKKYYVAPKNDEVVLYLSIKEKITKTIEHLCRSNYYDLMISDSVKLGYDKNKILSLNKIKEIRLVDFMYTSLKQLKRTIYLILSWCYSLICKTKLTVGLRTMALHVVSEWSDIKIMYLFHMTLDNIDMFNKTISMKTQNQKEDEWIGDYRDRPDNYRQRLQRYATNPGPYEQELLDDYDESTGILFGLELLQKINFDENERKQIKIDVIERHIICSKKRLIVEEFVMNTKFIDPEHWDKQDIFVNEQNDSIDWCENWGVEGVEWFYNEHCLDLNIASLKQGFIDMKYYWYDTYKSKGKEVRWPKLFNKIRKGKKKKFRCINWN
eukprot:531829_1